MSKKSSPILITGASGFLGGYLVDFLIQRGCIALTLGRSPLNSVAWSFDTRLKESPHAEFLIHCAWDLRISNRAESFATNVAGSLALFQAFRLKNPKGKIIFISSASAFEGNPTAYSESKLRVEEALCKKTDLVLLPGLLRIGSMNSGLLVGLAKLLKLSPVIPVPFINTPNLFFTDCKFIADVVLKFVREESPQAGRYYVGERRFFSLWEIMKDLKSYLPFPVMVPIPAILLVKLFRFVEKCGFRLRFRSDGLDGIRYLPKGSEIPLEQWIGF